jgi:cell division protein FtsZ
VVTKPFALEGDRRMRVAEKGIAELQQFVHTLIIIPNQNLFRVANDRTTMAQAFAMADEVLHAGVRGVTDLIVQPGLINLDFADIKAVITEMGKAMMGTGEAEGEDRAQRAADMAISNPLLDDVTMKGAKGGLINITGGPDLMLFEVEQAANRIRAEVDPDANIIFGNTILPEMEGRIRVSVVATGIDAELTKMPLPTEKVRTLHPHLNIRNRMAETPRPAPQPAPQPQYHPAATNPVHATMDVLANQIGADKSPAEDYILGGADAPQMSPQTEVAAVRYPAVETRRPLDHQPMAAGHVEPPKKGWSIFGRKKTAGDIRAEPMPEAPHAPAPRATAQVMPPQPAPQLQPQELPRNNADDLFPDHKRDEQFEIPAFLRRQSN